MSRPASMHSRSSARQAGGKRPPCVATPTTAVVGAKGSASSTVPTRARRPSSPPLWSSRARDSRDAASTRGCRAPSSRSADRRRSPQRVSDTSFRTPKSPALRREAARRPRIARPATGRRAAGGCRRGRRGRRATRCGPPGAMPSPDSTMQPSMTPSPSARAAVRHAHRLAHAARLRELDVDPVRALGARGDVGERVTVLVDVDRDRRGRAELRAAGISGRERLLAVLDAELLELRERFTRLVQRPVLVHVHLQRHVGHRPNRAHSLDVQSVPAAELELQPAEVGPTTASARRAMSSGSPSQIVHDVGGPEGRRPSRR